MFKKPEKFAGHDETKWLKDLTEQEKVGFTAGEMIVCKACGRKNPPSRLECLYCAAKLEIPPEKAKHLQLNLRVLEDWEKGWNVVWATRFAPSEIKEKAESAANLLKMEVSVVEKIASAEKPLPLARVESEVEAEMIAKQLSEFGIPTFLVSDEQLAVDILPTRIRAIEFFDNEVFLILLGKDDVIKINFADLSLFVVGSIFVNRLETSEQRKRNAESQIVESKEFSADEMALDFYTKNDTQGFRLSTKNFDFSCLENEKTLLATENFHLLLEKFRKIAPQAEFDENYRHYKNALNAVWQIEQKTDTKGMQKGFLSKASFENVVTTSNQTQFTRYSRFCWKLKDNES